MKKLIFSTLLCVFSYERKLQREKDTKRNGKK